MKAGLRVRILASAGRDADRALLAGFGTVTQQCARCGGDHGRPIMGEAGRWVSLSRAGGLVAVAFSTLGPVGVDLASRAAAARHPVAGVRHPDPAEWAGEWAATEAVLKADGRGLAVDPGDLTIAHDRVVAWRGCRVPLDTVRLRHFAVTDDIVGALAWFGEEAEPEFDVSRDLSAGSAAAARRSSAG